MADQTITISRLQIKRTGTPGARPAELARGEEFVNFADGFRLIGDGETPSTDLPAYPLRPGIDDVSGLAQSLDAVSGAVAQVSDAIAGTNAALTAGLGQKAPSQIETSPGISRSLVSKASEFVTLRDFGAVGDGIADDTAAVQKFFDFLRNNGGIGYVSGGTYDLKSTIQCYAVKPYMVLGPGLNCAVFRGSFNGYDKAVLSFSHPTNPLTSNRPKTVTAWGFSVAIGPAVTQAPVCIEARYATDLHLSNIYVSHWSVINGRGTAMRITAAYNCRLEAIKVWGAGCSRLHRTVSATVLFSIAAGATTLTANEAVFTAEDVGASIVLFGSAIEAYTIASVTSATAAEVTRASYQAMTNIPGCFDGAKVSMTAGSTILTLSRGTLPATDVGRVVYIPGAGATNFRGAKQVLRATIQSIASDGKSAVLSAACTNAVTSTYLILSPAFELCDDVQSQSNDIYIGTLHTEANAGVPVVIGGGLQIALPRMKTHGNNKEYVGGNWGSVQNITVAHMAIFNAEVSMDGIVEGVCSNNLGQIWVYGQSKSTKFGYTTGIGWAGTPFIYTALNAVWPVVSVEDRAIYTPYDPKFPLFASDNGSSSFRHTGTFTDGGANPPRNGSGYTVSVPVGGVASLPITVRRGKFKIQGITSVADSATIAYSAINGGQVETFKESGGPLIAAKTDGGALTGTTGTSGQITVSVSGANRLFYIENRTSVVREFWVRVEDGLTGT